MIEGEARVALNTKDRKGIERHIKIYESKIEEGFELKTKLQKLKLEEGEELNEIKAWSSKINNEIQKFNQIIEELQQFVKEIKSSEGKEEERELLLSKQRQHEMETELEKARYEQMIKFEKKLGECKANSNPIVSQSTNAKLPKLVISGMSPSSIHIEFRSLSPDIGGSIGKGSSSFKAQIWTGIDF